MAAGDPWACERELLGRAGRQTHIVCSMAGWEDKVVSGSSDEIIRVWDAGTGAFVAALAGSPLVPSPRSSLGHGVGAGGARGSAAERIE